jgi:hypothetical protein
MYASFPKDFHEGQTGGQIAVFLLKGESLMFGHTLAESNECLLPSLPAPAKT